MFLRLLAAFILIPLIELFLLLQLSEATSVLTTIALVVVTGIIGSWLARREGSVAWRRFRIALAEGRMPGREIQDGMMIAFAAALLLTPGLLTDALGFTLLVPAGRDAIRKFLVKRYQGRFRFEMHSQTMNRSENKPRDAHTIDAQSVERVSGR